MSFALQSLVAAALISVGAAAIPVVPTIDPYTEYPTFIDQPVFHQACSIIAPSGCNATQDSCCSEATNGIVVMTQAWDYTSTNGPATIWTLQDFRSESCQTNASSQSCNPSWAISDPVSILQNLNRTDLLAELYTNWKGTDGNDSAFWEQQFNQYGTCMTTLNPTCYVADAPEYDYALDYFATAFNWWKTYPTYKLLAQAGISPSTNQTHTVAEFKTFLNGWYPTGISLQCDDNNALTEISYYSYILSSIAYADFSPAQPTQADTCTDGFKWLPKTGSTNNLARAAASTVETAYITAINNTNIPFCLLSDGTLGAFGSCSNFTATGNPSAYTLSTSDGNCDVVNNVLTCGADVTAGDFTISSGFLAYDGEAVWFGSEDDSSPVNLGGTTSTYELYFTTATTTTTSSSSVPASSTTSGAVSSGAASSAVTSGASSGAASSGAASSGAASSGAASSGAASSGAASSGAASSGAASSGAASSGASSNAGSTATKPTGSAASSGAATETGSVTTITTVVSEYTTYCPESTTFTQGSKTYTVTEATTLTITDCPCTITTTVPCSSESEATKETEAPATTVAPEESTATEAPKESTATEAPKESTASTHAVTSQATPTQVTPTEAPTEPIRNSASTQVISLVLGLAVAAAPFLL